MWLKTKIQQLGVRGVVVVLFEFDAGVFDVVDFHLKTQFPRLFGDQIR